MSTINDNSDDNLLNTQAKRLRYLLEQQRLKQKDLAELLSVTRQYLSALMNNKKPLTFKLAKSIENATGFSHQWLLTGEGKQKAFVKSFWDYPHGHATEEDSALSYFKRKRSVSQEFVKQKLQTRNATSGDVELVRQCIANDAKTLEQIIYRTGLNKSKVAHALTKIKDVQITGHSTIHSKDEILSDWELAFFIWDKEKGIRDILEDLELNHRDFPNMSARELIEDPDNERRLFLPDEWFEEALKIYESNINHPSIPPTKENK